MLGRVYRDKLYYEEKGVPKTRWVSKTNKNKARQIEIRILKMKGVRLCKITLIKNHKQMILFCEVELWAKGKEHKTLKMFSLEANDEEELIRQITKL